MGPNGSGKTTLAYALMGHPAYQVTGRGHLEGTGHPRACRPTSAPAWACSWPSSTRRRFPACRSPASCDRAQRPTTRASRSDAEIDPSDPTRGGIGMRDFRDLMREKMALLKLETASPRGTSTRASRVARRSAWRCSRWRCFSQSSRSSMRPILGLDIDALRIVADGVNAMLNPDLGCALIEEDGSGPDFPGWLLTAIEAFMTSRFNLVTAGQTTVSGEAKIELANNFREMIKKFLNDDDLIRVKVIPGINPPPGEITRGSLVTAETILLHLELSPRFPEQLKGRYTARRFPAVSRSVVSRGLVWAVE